MLIETAQPIFDRIDAMNVNLHAGIDQYGMQMMQRGPDLMRLALRRARAGAAW
jgi:hypothetical protein